MSGWLYSAQRTKRYHGIGHERDSRETAVDPSSSREFLALSLTERVSEEGRDLAHSLELLEGEEGLEALMGRGEGQGEKGAITFGICVSYQVRA